MRRALLLLLPLLLPLAAGCSSVGGYWLGTCGFADGTYDYDVDVTLMVKRFGLTRLTGTMDLVLWEGTTLSDEMEGFRNGPFYNFEADYVVEGGSWVMDLDVEKSGSNLDGDCTLKVPGGTGALTGAVSLDR